MLAPHNHYWYFPELAWKLSFIFKGYWKCVSNLPSIFLQRRESLHGLSGSDYPHPLHWQQGLKTHSVTQQEMWQSSPWVTGVVGEFWVCSYTGPKSRSCMFHDISSVNLSSSTIYSRPVIVFSYLLNLSSQLVKHVVLIGIPDFQHMVERTNMKNIN